MKKKKRVKKSHKKRRPKNMRFNKKKKLKKIKKFTRKKTLKKANKRKKVKSKIKAIKKNKFIFPKFTIKIKPPNFRNFLRGRPTILSPIAEAEFMDLYNMVAEKSEFSSLHRIQDCQMGQNSAPKRNLGAGG